ncbi:MAG: hypothetical protein GC190_09595 [Alphaproteobacteria bacterium]|nr:hypothetical protein [Alphaproteobacteria bacterium]
MIEAVVFVCLCVAFAFALKATYARGLQAGVRQAAAEIAKGAHSNHHKTAARVPRRVQMCLNGVRAITLGTHRAPDRHAAVIRQLRRLGYELVAASEEDTREELRKKRQVDVVLTLRELLTLRWLAHVGFKLMMQAKAGDKFSFHEEKDAQESTFAIDRLEWSIPDEHKDPKEPYALGLCRQKMIWDRWPSGSAQQPADLQQAA